MRHRHVIWDWNGTLLDDAWLCVEILNGLLREADLPRLTVDEYRADFSFPVIGFYERRGFNFHTHSFDDVSQRYISAYNQRRYECQLQPGTHAALARLRDAGLEQSVLSAYHEDTLREAVTHYGLAQFFTRMSGLDNIRADGKVARGHAHLRALELHTAPHTVVLIGDTAHDHEVAAALGADCLLLHHGHMQPERLAGRGVPLMGSLSEAVDWVLSH
ncbi:MAG TPA: HAD family hydrolase [Opitutales bacterium]|jgi:phosphoglycolate phosphatase|nr:HAD family hydrolase [Opitutales bacterium]